MTLRFGERPQLDLLKAAIERLVKDRAVAGGEVWTAASARDFPVSEEERLRGGDRKIEVCLIVETLRVADAERVAAQLTTQFPQAATGAYRLLCEIRPD